VPAKQIKRPISGLLQHSSKFTMLLRHLFTYTLMESQPYIFSVIIIADSSLHV